MAGKELLFFVLHIIWCSRGGGSLIFSDRYAMNAILDAMLAKKLASRKLYVGQKLRVFCRFVVHNSLLFN